MTRTACLLALAAAMALPGCGKKDAADEGECARDCAQRACGLDPKCGESCGECGGGGRCVEGFCVCPGTGCGGHCCDAGQACVDGECCVQDCSATECGIDPVCGAPCSDCGGIGDCIDGICSCGATPKCGGTCCAAGEQCVGGQCCAAQCGGLDCGPDPVCGVSCGGCTDDRTCVAGTCECAGEECAGLCCRPGEQVCRDSLCCLMECGGMECGLDPHCGGSCGECLATETCHEGECLPRAIPDFDRDIEHTDLVFDVEHRTAVATLRFGPSENPGASVKVDGLTVQSVEDTAGGHVEWSLTGTRLDLGVPTSDAAVEVVIRYEFPVAPAFQGYWFGATGEGLTYTWPAYCGNLFPCHTLPRDGMTFGIRLEGLAAGDVAVVPEAVTFPGPAYMLSFAHGAFVWHDLGVTEAGTTVGVYYVVGGEQSALEGTARLRDVFNWYEKTLGAYRYGSRVGSVEANWGAGAGGGIEHHPYWQVATTQMADQEIHAHEATHGWYGNAVRMACWEDFVFSEGTVNYLVSRAFREVLGEQAETGLWQTYRQRLDQAAATKNFVAWPEGCNELDMIDSGMGASLIAYMRGARFYKKVADAVGVAVLDQALASFYQARQGTAVSMQAMLDHLRETTGFDPTDLAQTWLRTLEPEKTAW